MASTDSASGPARRDLKPLAFLWPFLRPYRVRVGLALLALLAAAGTVLAFGAALRGLIDHGFAAGRPEVLDFALATLLAAVVVRLKFFPNFGTLR